MGDVKAILFDLDNTLIDTAGAGRIAIKKVQELLRTRITCEDTIGSICDGFNAKLLQESYKPLDSTVDKHRISHWDEAIREAGDLGADHALAVDCYWLWKGSRLEHLCIPGPIRSLLEDLRKTHKLLLLTNGEAQTQREKISVAQCEDLFDAVVVGGEHVEEKPRPSIFHHCFRLLGVEPHDCVMVGDSLSTDILGGFNAGVRATVWIDGAGGTPSGAPAKPDYTIPTVLSLPTVLSKLK